MDICGYLNKKQRIAVKEYSFVVADQYNIYSWYINKNGNKKTTKSRETNSKGLG